MGEQRGSVLMLMPAAVLVVVVLSAVAVDAAISFMGRRELAAAAAAAANDAAVAALSERAFYEDCGALQLSDAAVAELAERTFAARDSDAYEVQAVSASAGAAPDGSALRVTVQAEGTVQLLFTPAVVGGGSRTVRAVSEAVAERSLAAPTGGCATGDAAASARPIHATAGGTSSRSSAARPTRNHGTRRGSLASGASGAGPNDRVGGGGPLDGPAGPAEAP